jgi:hypothetical protein
MNQDGPNPWTEFQPQGQNVPQCGGQDASQYQQGLGGSFDGIDQEFMLWKTQSSPFSGQIQWTEQSGERAAFRAGYLLASRKKI